MYRDGRQFATRFTHLPDELVREIAIRIAENDPSAACTTLTQFCSASRRLQGVCDDRVFAEAFEILFYAAPQGDPKSDFTSVCSDLGRLDGDERAAFLQSGGWTQSWLTRKRAEYVARIGEGGLTNLLSRRGAGNRQWSEYKLADCDLRRSTYEDEEERARSALQRGADPNGVQHGQSVLVMAANEGALAVVKLLLNAGADIDERDIIGSSALGWAIFQGFPNIVEELLEHGARVGDDEFRLAQKSENDLIRELVMAQR